MDLQKRFRDLKKSGSIRMGFLPHSGMPSILSDAEKKKQETDAAVPQQEHKLPTNVDAPLPSPTTVDDAWIRWQKTQSQDDMRTILQMSRPTMQAAIKSYAPNSSRAVMSKAKVLTRRAINTYDPSQKTKFSTYLMGQLRPLSREAASYSTVHIPEGVRFDISSMKQTHNEFVDEYDREPNDDELADRLGFSHKRLKHIRKYDKTTLSESAIFEADEESNLYAPAVSQNKEMWGEYVYDELSDVDKLIYDFKLGRNGRKKLPLSEIAKKLKMSSSAVSQRTKKISARIAEGEMDNE